MVVAAVGRIVVAVEKMPPPMIKILAFCHLRSVNNGSHKSVVLTLITTATNKNYTTDNEVEALVEEAMAEEEAAAATGDDGDDDDDDDGDDEVEGS